MNRQDDFYRYRRHLPHHRKKGVAYYITWRIQKDSLDLQDAEKDLIINTLRHFEMKRYELLAYVVMNDHVHVLVWIYSEYSLESVTHSWKSYTANQLQRLYGKTGAVWQDESYDRILRGEQDVFEKTRYIIENPERRWPDVKEYRWRWARGWKV